jgi:hypothetical protein
LRVAIDLFVSGVANLSGLVVLRPQEWTCPACLAAMR